MDWNKGSFVAALLFACLFASALHGDEPVEDLGQAVLQSKLFELTDVLEGEDAKSQVQFSELLARGINRSKEARRNNVFEAADPQMRELAVKLYTSILMLDIDRVDADQREYVSWMAMFICDAIPSDLAADALVRAVDGMDDPRRMNDPRYDVLKLVYGLDGSSQLADYDPVMSRLTKTEGELREKLIAHLINFAPTDTFRLILEEERKSIEGVAALSWFDRLVQEEKWASRNRIKLEPAFHKQLDADWVRLLDHQTWWVRLYALELLDKRRALSDMSPFEKLKDDPNRFVSRRARELLEKKAK